MTFANGYGPIPTIQTLPETWSDERMHILDETCWCRPTMVFEGDGYVRLLHSAEVQQ